MTLQVIGAGFGRTGTLSLKTGLEQLGFTKCHHMQEVMGGKGQVPAWHSLSHGEPADWDRIFEGFQASCDWPSSAYWERLYHHYPECKVILTVRDEDRWYESVAETIYPLSMNVPSWIPALVPAVRRIEEMIVNTVWDGVFDGRFEDRAHAIRVFRDNTARVKEVVDPERLLVFEAKDGWEPLCAFLGVPVPETSYPHVNEAASMKRGVRVLRALRWLPHAALTILAGVAVAWWL